MSEGGEKRKNEYYNNKILANFHADKMGEEEEKHFQTLALCCGAQCPLVSCTVDKEKRKRESKKGHGSEKTDKCS